MDSKKYIDVSQNLIKAAEIAIESLKRFPPKEWDNVSFNHTLNCCFERLFLIKNPEPKYRNLRSLKYLEKEVFTRFQEGAGENIEEFWRRIKEEGLPNKRTNKLKKILKLKKINNDFEYDFVIDVIVSYRQEGLITEEEVILLNKYLGVFELKNM
ncbi:hypothetical protein [Flavobacterium sp.]|uniref:hypothetical protein n=1 Tax=Flavobacterium sp. TaxID=239 RepID=UPI003752A736